MKSIVYHRYVRTRNKMIKWMVWGTWEHEQVVPTASTKIAMG